MVAQRNAPIRQAIADEICNHLEQVAGRYKPQELAAPGRIKALRDNLRLMLLADAVQGVLYGFREVSEVAALGGVPLAAMWRWRIERASTNPPSTPAQWPRNAFWQSWPFVFKVQLGPGWGLLQPDEQAWLAGGTAAGLQWLNNVPDTLLIMQRPILEFANLYASEGILVTREHYSIG